MTFLFLVNIFDLIILVIIFLKVGPEIEVETSEVEHVVGSDVRLECRIKANPLVNHYWMKDDKVIENSVMNMHFARDPTKVVKYEMNIFNQNNIEYLTVSSLVIKVRINILFNRFFRVYWSLKFHEF